MDLCSQNYISLAAGVGGLDLGVHMALRDARLVCAVEIEAYACEVLAERMEEGYLDPAPVWTDLRTFDGRPWRDLVDGIVAGVPCQPWSVAGKQRGEDDPRHLWPAAARIIREVGPSWVFFENVAGHLPRGTYEVTRDLQGMGYDVAAGLFTAEEVGATHKRERIFILAMAHSSLRRQCDGGDQPRASDTLEGDEREDRVRGCGVGNTSGITEREQGHKELWAHGRNEPERAGGVVGNADSEGREGRSLHGRERPNERTVGSAGCSVADADDDGREGKRSGGVSDGESSCRSDVDGHGRSGLRVVPFPPRPDDAEGWREYLDTFGEDLAPAVSKPPLRSSADGLAGRLGGNRLDELRACGNGVVPLQAAFAFVSLHHDLVAYRSARAGGGTTRTGSVEPPELEV